jgi:hypothetical protein
LPVGHQVAFTEIGIKLYLKPSAELSDDDPAPFLTGSASMTRIGIGLCMIHSKMNEYSQLVYTGFVINLTLGVYGIPHSLMLMMPSAVLVY